MKIRSLYKILSIFSLIFGVFLLLNSQIKTVGAIIGIKYLQTNISVGFGVVFILLGAVLFLIEKRHKE